MNSLKAEECKMTILSALLLFLIIAAFVVLKSARDALVLSKYPARTLPYFMVTTTLTAGLVAAAYLRLYTALMLGRAVSMCLIAFAAGTLLFWLGITLGWGITTPVLYVWIGVFGTLAPVQAWSVISQQLLARQAKRTLGMIGAGGIMGSIVGGLFARWMALGGSVSALLPTAAVLILLALFLSLALSAPHQNREGSGRGTEPPQVRQRFVVLVLVVVGTGTLVSTFVDFQFKVTAQRELATAEALAVFFGSFYAYLGGATLLFQVLATPVLMRRLRMSAALSFLPLALVVSNTLVLAAGMLWSVVLLKGSEQLFKHSVDRSALEVLYLAIPDHAKIRLRSLIDTMGVRISEGVAAMLLVLLFSVGNLSVSVLALISTLFLAIWIGSTILLGREYPQVLEDAIQRREIDLEAVKATFFTSDFYRLLPELLRSSEKRTVMDLLELLETSDERLELYLDPLLQHEDVDVRLKVLQLLFTQDDDLSGQVERLLGDADRRVRVEAVHYLCLRSPVEPMEKLCLFLEDPDLTVQAAAAACALNQEMETAQQRAYQRLEELLAQSLSQSQPEVRLEIAHILEHVRPSAALEQLCQRLLSDPFPEVRKAAMRSVARTHPLGVVPALIEALYEQPSGSPVPRSEVRAVLSSYGEALFPHLRKVLEDEEGSLEQKKWALKIAADIGGPQALELLVAMAHGADLVLRFAAIKALNRLKKHQPLESAHPALESLLGQEIHTLEIEVQRARSFSPQPHGLMEAVLSQRQVWAWERTFRVLALLYEPDRIYHAYLALIGEDRRRADAALELLDTILNPSHRRRILPLLESHRRAETGAYKAYNRSERKAVLFCYLQEQDPLPAAAGIADLSAEELSLWRVEIREALEALQEAESREQGTESERHAPCSMPHVLSDLSLVEETLNWRYAQMETPPKLQETKYRRPGGSSVLTTLQKLENLSKVDIFSRLGPYELLVLANQSVEVEFQPGQSIFVEGEIAQEVFSLVRGSVELRRASGYVEMVKPGESFGTLAVLTRQPRLFSARALERCLCLKLDRESFWEILEDYPAVCQGIFEVLVHRIQTLTD